MGNKIKFTRYDNHKKGFYHLKDDETITEVSCAFDRTPIIFNYEFGDFFCPNCGTNYEYAESQEEIDNQKSKIIERLMKKAGENKEIEEKLKILEKL